MRHTISQQDIRKAYLESVLLHHPDRAGSDQAEGFLRVKAAYDVLGDPELRQKYDDTIVGDDMATSWWDTLQEKYNEVILRAAALIAHDIHWTPDVNLCLTVQCHQLGCRRPLRYSRYVHKVEGSVITFEVSEVTVTVLLPPAYDYANDLLVVSSGGNDVIRDGHLFRGDLTLDIEIVDI